SADRSRGRARSPGTGLGGAGRDSPGCRPAPPQCRNLPEYVDSRPLAEEPEYVRSCRTARAAAENYVVPGAEAGGSVPAQRLPGAAFLLGPLVLGLQSRGPDHRSVEF